MSRPYQNSLFSCCSPFNLCMKAWCCPCVVYGRNNYRLKHGSNQGYDTMNGPCFAWCALGVLGGWGWILQCLNRTEMQEKYNLEGSGCGTCCASCCCNCCELVQTAKELEYVQVSQNDPALGYTKQAAMNASPFPVQQPQQAAYGQAAYGAPPQPHA